MSKVAELRTLFENGEYEKVVSGFVETSSETTSLEEAKEVVLMGACSNARLIDIHNYQNRMSAIEMSVQFLGEHTQDNLEKLKEYSKIISEHVNERFCEMIEQYISTIQTRDDYQNIGMFLLGKYNEIGVNIAKLLYLQVHEDYYSNQAKVRMKFKMQVYNRASELHEETIKLSDNYQGYFHTIALDVADMFLLIDAMMSYSIPTEEECQYVGEKALVDWIADAVAVKCNFMNAEMIQEGGRRIPLAAINSIRTRVYGEIDTLTARIIRHNPEYECPEFSRALLTEEPQTENSSEGCYIATGVYGSYDCPEVWILRRYRDLVLRQNFFGKIFVKIYYSISPMLVKWFGKTEWFNKFWKSKLDRLVYTIQQKNMKYTAYDDNEGN